MLLMFMPIESMSLRVKPVWTRMKLFGIKPKYWHFYQRKLLPESIYKAFPPKVKPSSQTSLESKVSISRKACTRTDFVYEHWPYCEILQTNQEIFLRPRILPKSSSRNSKDWLQNKNRTNIICTLRQLQIKLVKAHIEKWVLGLQKFEEEYRDIRTLWLSTEYVHFYIRQEP